jgi:hypothetical protein
MRCPFDVVARPKVWATLIELGVLYFETIGLKMARTEYERFSFGEMDCLK